MEVELREIDPGADLGAVETLLCSNRWPFHRHERLDPARVRGMSFGPPGTRSFWIVVGGERVGLLRLQDIEDIGDGAPVFDIRIAEGFRGRGAGAAAVRRLASLVFREYAAAHRLEATTRADNVAMRRTLERCGFRLEGLLRETWPARDGLRHDTALYGLLRREWEPGPGDA